MARTLRSALLWAGLVLLAIATGVLAAKPVTLWVASSLALHDGPWETFSGAGSASADPYTRAAIAIAGLYALSARAAIYYTAFDDDHGRPLRSACDYVVTGTAPPARWWSLTLYGADGFLVANPQHRYSWNGGNVARGADRRFTVRVSSRPQPDDWLPAPASGRFSLMLRLYGLDAAVRSHPASPALPTIVAEHCR